MSDSYEPQEIDDLFSSFESSIPPSSIRSVTRGSDGRRDEGSCRFCDSLERTMCDGVWSCLSCHTLVGRVLDYGAEWRSFPTDEGRADVSRCSTLTCDLITPLGCALRAGGSGPGVGQRARACRSGAGAVMMSRHQSWNALTYRERSLCKVFVLMSARTSMYSIASSIVQEAKHMYKHVSLNRIFRGDARLAAVAACVYMALRSSHVPRSICEVADMFQLESRSAMIRACNLFHSTIPRQLDSSRASDFVCRFGCRLGLDPGIIALCYRIALRVDASYLVSDCTPPSVVGAIMHMVNQRESLGIKRDVIAEACMVSSGTIARCCRRMMLHQAELFSDFNLSSTEQVGG